MQHFENILYKKNDTKETVIGYLYYYNWCLSIEIFTVD